MVDSIKIEIDPYTILIEMDRDDIIDFLCYSYDNKDFDDLIAGIQKRKNSQSVV
jgi:hypothetical protein